MLVRVQVPLRVPNGARGQKRPLVSFYDLLKYSPNEGMRKTDFQEFRVATFEI